MVAPEVSLEVLTAEERSRYSRHILLPEIGVEGQQRLKSARVLLVGAGGLGSPVALYLAAAGIGTIGLIDGDIVDESNLQRQVLFTEEDIGHSKAFRGSEHLKEMNRHVQIVEYHERLTSENGPSIVQEFDVIVDGADNFSTRYLCNDLSVLFNRPLVHGSIFRFEGQMGLFNYVGSPCYRCLYPHPPEPGSVPSCGEIGVLGVLPGVIGGLMATEVLKLVTGNGRSMAGRILLYDALQMETRQIRYNHDPDCPVCGNNPTIRAISDYDYTYFCAVSDDGTSGTVRGHISETQAMEQSMSIPAIEVEELSEWREARKPHTLIDVREENEYEFANLGGTLIPLGQVQDRLDEIPEDGEVVIMCRSGGRSGQACAMLMAAGRTNIRNLTGGILAWSDRVDSSIPKY